MLQSLLQTPPQNQPQTSLQQNPLLLQAAARSCTLRIALRRRLFAHFQPAGSLVSTRVDDARVGRGGRHHRRGPRNSKQSSLLLIILIPILLLLLLILILQFLLNRPPRWWQVRSAHAGGSVNRATRRALRAAVADAAAAGPPRRSFRIEEGVQARFFHHDWPSLTMTMFDHDHNIGPCFINL